MLCKIFKSEICLYENCKYYVNGECTYNDKPGIEKKDRLKEKPVNTYKNKAKEIVKKKVV
jgi:hypothetical protein